MSEKVVVYLLPLLETMDIVFVSYLLKIAQRLPLKCLLMKC